MSRCGFPLHQKLLRLGANAFPEALALEERVHDLNDLAPLLGRKVLELAELVP